MPKLALVVWGSGGRAGPYTFRELDLPELGLAEPQESLDRSCYQKTNLSIGRAVAASSCQIVVFAHHSLVLSKSWLESASRLISDSPMSDVLVGRLVTTAFGSESRPQSIVMPPEHLMAVRASTFRDVGGFDGKGAGAGLDFLWRAELGGHLILENARPPVLARKSFGSVLRLQSTWAGVATRVNDLYSAHRPKSSYLKKSVHRSQLGVLGRDAAKAWTSSGPLSPRGRTNAVRSLILTSEALGQVLDLAGAGLRRGILMAPDWRANPYQTLFYRAFVEAGFPIVGVRQFSLEKLAQHSPKCGILHLHWIQGVCSPETDAPGTVERRLQAARWMRYKIVWTIHNESTHDTAHPARELALRRAIAAASDLVIVHSRMARDYASIELRVPSDRLVVMPHGTYEGVYPAGTQTSSQLRSSLGIPPTAPCSLFFGQVRPYKGLEAFLPVWRRTAEPDWHLVIAGMAKPKELGVRLIELAEGDSRIHFILEHIDDEQVAAFLEMSDLVVLPYNRILTSGSAALASTFGRRVLAPRLGALPEIYDQFPETALLYDPGEGPASKLRQGGGLRVSDLDDRTVAAFERFKTRYSWKNLTSPVVVRFKRLKDAS